MTGSLQIKNGKYYMVLNSTKNGKRKQRWIATGLPEKGNKRRAEQMLREKLSEEEHKAPNGEAANIWFTEYIQYFLTISQQRVDEVTFQNYQMIAKRHVLPWFEGKRLLLSEVNRKVLQEFLFEKFYRFSDYLGTTSQMSELLGISSISGILRFGRYPAYHGISEPHLAVKSSKTVVENRPYY